jgi:hypothetical protein
MTMMKMRQGQAMNSAFLIEHTAQEFWALVGEAPSYPGDIKMAITLTMPLELYGVPGLRVADVLEWTQKVRIAYDMPGYNRRLHGCLLADRDKGTIFYDAGDSGDEQRFTLAHELAHFLLDYQAPRRRAITILGPSILAVLDGERPPTISEQLHAALSDVSLGPMSHFMERPDEGLPASIVLDIENRADRLALELLAPASCLQEMMIVSTAPRGFNQRLSFLTQQLIVTYGLPATIADSYARYILAQMGESGVYDWLFATGDEIF